MRKTEIIMIGIIVLLLATGAMKNTSKIGRYQLCYAQMKDMTDKLSPLIFKIDTATGQCWRTTPVIDEQPHLNEWVDISTLDGELYRIALKAKLESRRHIPPLYPEKKSLLDDFKPEQENK